jgi:hypothetical protein
VSKPVYNTPQLAAGWTHYAAIHAACPLMDDTLSDISGQASRTITLTDPDGIYDWADGSAENGTQRGLLRSNSGNPAGVNTLAVQNFVPNSDDGTVILIYEMLGNPTVNDCRIVSSNNFYMTRASSGAYIDTKVRGRQFTGSTSVNSGNYLSTAGGSQKVCILTWGSNSRSFYQSGLDNGVDPTDGYDGTATTGTSAQNDCNILSNSTGTKGATNVLLLGWVVLTAKLSVAQSKAVIASPWAWLEDGAATNNKPVFNGNNITQITGTEGSAISTLDVSNRFSDPDNDTLTFSAGGVWPARQGGGLWVSSAGVISGTPATGSAATYSGLTVIADDGTDTTPSNSFSFLVNAPSGTLPNITSVSGNAIEGGALTITGTNLSAATVALSYSGVSVVQTILSNTATEVIISVAATILPYGSVSLVLATTEGSDSISANHLPETGKDYVVVDVPWSASAFSIFDGNPDTAAVDGDQIEFDTASNHAAVVDVFSDGTFIVYEDDRPHVFEVRIWDESALVWGDATSIIAIPANYTPGAPQWVGPDVESLALEEGDQFTIDFTDKFTDPDDDISAYFAVGTWPPIEVIGQTIVGTAEIGEYPNLTIRAEDYLGQFADSNTFSISVTEKIIVVDPENIDRISVEHKGRSLNERNSVELVIRTYNEAGLSALPTTLHWRLDDSCGEIQGFTLESPTKVFDDEENLADCYVELSIPGSLNAIRSRAKVETKTLLIVCDKDMDSEISLAWEYTVRNLIGRV